jgi:hypothetical protein
LIGPVGLGLVDLQLDADQHISPCNLETTTTVGLTQTANLQRDGSLLSQTATIGAQTLFNPLNEELPFTLGYLEHGVSIRSTRRPAIVVETPDQIRRVFV